MTRVNILEAEARLPTLLDGAVQGEQLVLCRRNVPVAELCPPPKRRREPGG